MYQYTILKKGRKWYEAETADEKKFKAQIEINAHSENWKVGETVYDDMDIYGGGCKILIVDDKIWAIKNNGMDGDFWGANNVRAGGAGAIGHYMEIDDKCKSYIDKIKNCADKH